MDRMKSASPQIDRSGNNGRFHLMNRGEPMASGHSASRIHTQGLGDHHRIYLKAQKDGVGYAIVGREVNLAQRTED